MADEKKQVNPWEWEYMGLIAASAIDVGVDVGKAFQFMQALVCRMQERGMVTNLPTPPKPH